MKRILLSIICSSVFCTALLAQDSGEKKPVKGTYQIEVHNTRGYPYLPDNLPEMIRKARLKDKTNYIIISDYVKIRVLPESVINAPGFTPVTPEVTFNYN